MNQDPIFGLLILLVISLFVYLHFKKQSVTDFFKEMKGKI